MRNSFVLFLVTGLSLQTFAAPADNVGSAFSEIRKAIYDSPRADLPTYPGMNPWSVIKNFIGSESRPQQGLGIQSRRILVDESDIRNTTEPKWLHPRGACAEARWTIDTESPATGMFAAGINVPAIVRLSSGDAASAFPTDGRIFGLAIKIFPTQNLNQRIKTTNIITLDQYGFERSKRASVFVNEGSSEPIYFSNVAPAKSALGKFLSQFFDRFDKPNFARPLYATARANLGGGELIESRTPYEVRFVADPAMKKPTKSFPDFRNELQSPQKRTLLIVIQSFDSEHIISKTIGRLELGKFVVSDFCDLGINFHHSSLEDQWSKYTDYESVKDFAK